MTQDSSNKAPNNEGQLKNNSSKKKKADKKYAVFRSTPKNMKIDSRVELLSSGGSEEASSPRDTLFPPNSHNQNTQNTNKNISNSTSITISNNSTSATVSPSATTFTMTPSPSELTGNDQGSLVDGGKTSNEPSLLDCNRTTTATSSATTITTTTTTTCSNGATLNGVRVVKKQR